MVNLAIGGEGVTAKFIEALKALCNSVPDKAPCVSVVIPAYKLRGVVRATVERVSKVLSEHGVTHEVIIVDDGSNDGTAEDATKAVPGRLCRRLLVLSYGRNRGKGFALSVGALHASAPYTAFIDGDGDIRPEQLLLTIPPLLKWDVVVTSKYHPQAKLRATKIRKVLGNTFRLIVKILTGVNVRDTQTGCKAFKTHLLKKAVKKTYIKHYAHDVELLIILRKLGARMIEIPALQEVRLQAPFKPRNIAKMLLDILSITYRHVLTHTTPT